MKSKQVKQPVEEFKAPDTCGKCKYAKDSWNNGALSLTCTNERSRSHDERVRPLQLACRVFAG